MNEPEIADFAALIEADVKTSGARTPDEIKKAFIASVASFMSPVETRSEILRTEGNGLVLRLSARSPRLPSGKA